MFRFFPTIREENESIRAAMKMRGVRFGGGKVGQILEYRIVPRITCTAKIGEELSAAALTRGLDTQKKDMIIRKAKGLMLIFIGIIILGTFVINFAGTGMTGFMNSTSSVLTTSYLSKPNVLSEIKQHYGHCC